jgi:hypothetical protein
MKLNQMDKMADNIGYRTRTTLMEYMPIAKWNIRGTTKICHKS